MNERVNVNVDTYDDIVIRMQYIYINQRTKEQFTVRTFGNQRAFAAMSNAQRLKRS